MFFASLPADVRATIEVAIAQGVRGTAMNTVLERYGFTGIPRSDNIFRHIKEKCSCHRQ